jgi:hypothetical protein
MLIDELATQLYARVAPDAPRGTRQRTEARLGPHHVEVTLSIDRQGLRTMRWFCDGKRVSRPTLQKLLCTETACPDAQAVRERWRAFHGLPAVLRRRDPGMDGGPHPLMRVLTIEEAGHRCELREASFQCLTRCPQQAHGPRELRKWGWDLFEDGEFIGGGVKHDGATGHSAPRFATPDDARRWLNDHRALAQQALPGDQRRKRAD